MGGTARGKRTRRLADASLGCGLKHIPTEASPGNHTIEVHVCARMKGCQGAYHLPPLVVPKAYWVFAGSLILLRKCFFFLTAYFKPAVNSVFCFRDEECELRGFIQILGQIKGSSHESPEEPVFLSCHCREGEGRQWPY